MARQSAAAPAADATARAAKPSAPAMECWGVYHKARCRPSTRRPWKNHVEMASMFVRVIHESETPFSHVSHSAYSPSALEAIAAIATAPVTATARGTAIQAARKIAPKKRSPDASALISSASCTFRTGAGPRAAATAGTSMYVQ